MVGNVFLVNFFVSNLYISKWLLAGNIFFFKIIVSGASDEWYKDTVKVCVAFLIHWARFNQTWQKHSYVMEIQGFRIK